MKDFQLGQSQWYYASNKKKVGPVTFLDLQQLAARGTLRPEDMVLQESTARWQTADSVAGLFAPASSAAQAELPFEPTPLARQAAPPSGQQDSAVKQLWNRARDECRLICAETFTQAGRLVGFVNALVRKNSLAHTLLQTQLTLGNRLYEAGHGDAQLHSSVASLDEKITGAGEDKRLARKLQEDRRTLLIQLASAAMPQQVPPTGAEVEYNHAKDALHELQSQQAKTAALKAALWPSSLTGWRRVGVGYAAILCALLLVVNGTFSGKQKKSWTKTPSHSPQLLQQDDQVALSSGSRSESDRDPKRDERSEAKPGAIPTPASEPAPEPKIKPEPRVEAAPKPKVESKPEPEPEAKPVLELKPDSLPSPREPSSTPAKEASPAGSPGTQDPPLKLTDEESVNTAERIVRRLLSVDSTKYKERGYAGFIFGDSYDSLKAKLKDDAGSNSEEKWLTTDEVWLLFRKGRLVGVQKQYNSAPSSSADALVERFGKAPPERITKFASVTDRYDKSYTGEQLLIRYCFPHCVVYGYICYETPLDKPFLVVSVFDREYLEGVLSRDIQQKHKILKTVRPVITYAFGDSVKWNEIPFPKMNGTHAQHGTNFLEANVGILEGRSAPQGDTQSTYALVVEDGSDWERKATGFRYMRVTINFNSFPAFEMHPLTTPQGETVKNAAGLVGGVVWHPSRGSLNVEHDAQLCNSMVVGMMFPSANSKMEVRTVFNNVTFRSIKGYSWETEEKYTVQVLGNNKILIIKPSVIKLKID